MSLERPVLTVTQSEKIPKASVSAYSEGLTVTFPSRISTTPFPV